MVAVTAIYLDNNSTTRMAPEVFDAMSPFLRERFGNPSSLHSQGQSARHAIESAREQVAALIGARPREIVFTSGGTESDNLAILGTLAAYSDKRHIVTTAVEHPAVFGLCERLAKQGCRVTFVGVDRDGHLDEAAYEAALTEDCALVSVMHANNETGVIFPIQRLAARAAQCGIPFHTDAVQTAGKIPIDVNALGVNLLSLSAHKIHGPKGVGALCVGRGMRLRNQQVGGHQERDLRPGTENVAAIVGMGVACDLASRRLQSGSWSRVAALRDRIEAGLLERLDYARRIGDPDVRVPNTTTVAFERLEAEAILIALSEAGVCASSGSACSSGSLEPSHVLQAMGIERPLAHGAVRFSLSEETTDAEIAQALEIVPRVVGRLATLGGVCR